MNLQIKQNLKNSYDDKAVLRDQSELPAWKLKEMKDFLVFFDEGEESRILDLGAGTGQHSLYMKERGLEVTCIDLSSNMVELCLQKGLKAYEMDFYHIHFEDNHFNGIWAMNTLLHVPKQDLLQVLEGVRRVLKPGGLFYMGVYGGYNSEGIWDEDTYSPKRFFSFYDEVSMKEMVSQVFKLESFKTVSLDGMELDFQGMILRKE
ncbi:hypothetical protein AWM70_06050 [Paenibacillus yonginensis]|uniref:Methyltransferase type 11 domain-containing protein n=1 Tax=Paenibacillus yonginensis TaxID=1462996 RepID=A0A1B1MYE1_9BACL|nr:class I SAM-dependent methyltransferase [Paenibacillus yonginensis]ANS74198.1 hypothetical protein AWM70_06050 [Paenibacillus yonginensis]